MSLHDYSISNYNAMFSSVLSLISLTDNAILSIEGQSFEWDFTNLNAMVQCAEINYILGQKEELHNLFAKGSDRLEKTSTYIGRLDSGISSELDSSISSLQEILSGMSKTEGLLSEYVSVNEPHTWMCGKKAQIYKIGKYVTYNNDTGKYEYNWSSLALDLQNGAISSDDASEVITDILYTLVDENNNIDTNNLEMYLKVLASNGHCYASLNAPDPSEATYLQQLADAIEPTNAYYLAAIQRTEEGSPERDALVTRLSMNNIVITASKTVKTTEYKEDFASYTKYQIPSSNKNDALNKPGTLFWGNDGVLYNVTQMQPAAQWVKSDKTAQQLQAEGKPFQIRGNIRTGGDVYELRMPGQQTLYRTDVSLTIKQEAAAYYDNSDGLTHTNKNCTCYTIDAGSTRSLVIDYTSDTVTATKCAEKKYREYAEKYNVTQIASLKKAEQSVEDDVKDRAKKKVDKDLQKYVKKYSIKLITEFVPGFDLVESAGEDIIGNVYGVYKDRKEVKEWNEKVDAVIAKYKNTSKNIDYMDDIFDSIVHDMDEVGINVTFDNDSVTYNIQ